MILDNTIWNALCVTSMTATKPTGGYFFVSASYQDLFIVWWL